MAKRRSKVLKPKFVSPAMRERILSGAAEAFGKLGYAKVRVEDILLAADVSRPTFYKVYRTKDDVFEALSERHHQEIQKRILLAAEGSADPSTLLEATVDTFMRWRAGLGAIGRVLDLEARTPGTMIAHHRRATLAAMTRLSEERMRAAGRAPVDPVLTYALIAAMESVADSLLADGAPTEEVIGRAKHNALRIVASTLADPDEILPEIPRPPP